MKLNHEELKLIYYLIRERMAMMRVEPTLKSNAKYTILSMLSDKVLQIIEGVQ